MKKSSIFIIFLAVLAEILFLKLAWWQYDRMLEKEERKSMIISSLEDNTRTFSGTFDHTREILLESQQYKNVYGYRVFTPLVVNEQEEVIVDRGWLPRRFDANFLKAYIVLEPVTVTGVLRTPPILHKPLWYGPTEGQGAEGVRIIKILDLSLVPQQPLLERMPNYLQATSQTHQGLKAFFDVPVGGEKHREYMLTWLSFALLLPVLVFKFLRKA